MVMNQFIDAYDLNINNLDLYYLDLLNYRAISDEVGIKFMIMHESPQLILIKNGKVMSHASHGAINNIELQNYI